jgi:2-polyprenyl-6-methoxyphenol hydroxylase-like FAD-dependent oxidoreductase
MDLPHSTDVFVIGGGPAGLAAAIAARRRGFEVTVADLEHPPVDKACGEGIMPDGLAAARALGVNLEGEGQAFRGIRFCHGGERVQADFPQGRGLGIRRTALHRIMAEQAERAGVRLAWGTRITGIGERPARMADLMLLLDRRTGLLDRTMRAMAAHPPLFSRLLAMHLEEHSAANYLANNLLLGWRLVTL